MKLKAVSLTVMAAAAAAMVAACGGGGGTTTEASSVQLSGVAATGLALANSTVDVKCAAGTGSATTNDAGSYTVSVPDGQLPCIVKVTGTANGVPVVLHSLAEGSGTTATANVTPLTELILARAAGMSPAGLFEVGAASAPSATALSQATTAVLTAFGGAAGVDLTGVDPFKSPLVAATETNPTAGNEYDKLLDELGKVVTPALLHQIVEQVASPEPLEQVVANVKAGTLANCPQALSGKYRVLDYNGELATVKFDFGTNKVSEEGSSLQMDLTPSATQPCEFSIADGNGTTIVIGPQGAGALWDENGTALVFPAQSLSYGAVQGEWQFIESGLEEDGAPTHFVGKINFAADRTVSVCDYDVAGGITSACTPDDEPPQAPTETSDGGFTMAYGDTPVTFYGFRSPLGTVTLYGSSNVVGSDELGVMRSHLVAFKPRSIGLPQVNSGRQQWDLLMRGPLAGPLTSGPLGRTTQTYTAVDTTAGTYSRVKSDTPAVTDVFTINKPLAGFVHRIERPIYATTLPGTDVTLAINAPGNTSHLYSVTVIRP